MCRSLQSRADNITVVTRCLPYGYDCCDGEHLGGPAEAAAVVITGGLHQGENGRWISGKGAPSAERLKPLWTHLRPALERVARWWDGVRGRVEALPDPDQQAFFDEVPPEGAEEGPGF